MAVRFDVAGDYLSDATNVVNYNSTYTWMCWFRKVTATGLNEFIRAYTSTAGNNGREAVYINTSNQIVGVVHTGTNTDTAGSTITTGTDYHIAMVRESVTSFKVYLNGVLDVTITTDVTSRTASNGSYVGTFETTSRLFNGSVSWAKEWTRALTINEVKAEMLTIRPQNPTSLYRWVPVFSGTGNRGKDFSGNGRNFTENGTLTDELGKIIAYGGGPLYSNIGASGGTTYTRTISESITATDTPLRSMQAFRQIPIDSITMDELLLKSTQFGRIASDQITITESMQRAAYLYRQETDTTVVNDGLLRYAQLIRNLLDQFDINDSLIITITFGGVTIVSRILTDNIDITELVMRAANIYRQESQALDVYDGTWYSASVVRQAIELLTTSESIAKSLQRSRVIADTTDISDIAFRYALLNRLLHEDAEASDSLVAQITYFQQLLGFIMQTLEKEPILYKNTVAMNIETDLTENTGIRMELTKI